VEICICASGELFEDEKRHTVYTQPSNNIAKYLSLYAISVYSAILHGDTYGY
jgi:hypothetical protein